MIPQHPRLRPIYVLLCLVILLASCSGGPVGQGGGPPPSPTAVLSPSKTPGAPPATQAQAPTTAPPATQAEIPTAAPAATQPAATTVQADTFVVPAKQSEA